VWSFAGGDKKLAYDSLWVLWFFLRDQLLPCSKEPSKVAECGSTGHRKGKRQEKVHLFLPLRLPVTSLSRNAPILSILLILSNLYQRTPCL